MQHFKRNRVQNTFTQPKPSINTITVTRAIPLQARMCAIILPTIVLTKEKAKHIKTPIIGKPTRFEY